MTKTKNPYAEQINARLEAEYIRDLEHEMYEPEEVPELFQYNPLVSKIKWFFPITPYQVANRFVGTIQRDLEYIWQNCEITDEPEDLANYQGHGTGQHVSPAEVAALKELLVKAEECAASQKPRVTGRILEWGRRVVQWFCG